MRLDRNWLDAATFPVVTQVVPRFSDVDPLGHVNNVAAVDLLQEGRTAFNRSTGERMVADGLRTMVVSLVVEYAAEIRYPTPVEIRTGVLDVGRTSFSFAQLALQDERPVLYSRATFVMADAHGPVPIPEAVRAEYWRLSIVPAASVKPAISSAHRG